MPNVLGQFFPKAERLMRAAGWVGELVKLPNARDTDYPANAIVKQDPAAGQRQPIDTDIQLQFAGN